MENLLLEVIKETLEDVHIETGRKDDFEKICNLLERNISNRILSHHIDYYSECLKT